MMKTKNRFPEERPYTKRGIPQDLVGVFGSPYIHGLKASDVVIQRADGSTGEDLPLIEAGDVFENHLGQLFRVRCHNFAYAAVEDVVTREITLLDCAHLVQPKIPSGNTYAFEYLASQRSSFYYRKLDPETARVLERQLLQNASDDMLIQCELYEWDVRARNPDLQSVALYHLNDPGRAVYLVNYMAKGSEIFIKLTETRSLKLYSTWLPQRVYPLDVDALLKSETLSKLLDLGHVAFLAPDYAERMLDLHSASIEYERLQKLTDRAIESVDEYKVVIRTIRGSGELSTDEE